MIEVCGVWKRYHRDGKVLNALQDVSLTIANRDIYGIIGLSGAGKSTLIRCLAGLIDPSEGRILFNGRDISSLNKHDLRGFRKNIGMIFQHFNLLSSRTVAGNIAYPMEIIGVQKEEQEKRILDLLHIVGLSGKKDAYPAQLSGGEKQRVGIARALANQPEVLLCDEATSSLDPKTTREILILLKTINQQLGVTIVLITHEMDVIKRICNKVAVIEGGSIIEAGPTSTLFANPKHATTRNFVQSGEHEIPRDFFKRISPTCRLLRLRFKGQVAGEPIIAHLVKKFQVDANILLGWIDYVQDLTIGTLIIELLGSPEGIDHSLRYLKEQSVECEFLHSSEVE